MALTADPPVPLHVVAARLGDDPKTVLGTYAHLLPQSDELAADAVAAALTPKSSMSKATLRGSEFDIFQFTDDAEWVLRDRAGDVILFEENDRERVAVRCDFCGRWSTDAAPVATNRWESWMCHGGTGPCPVDDSR